MRTGLPLGNFPFHSPTNALSADESGAPLFAGTPPPATHAEREIETSTTAISFFILAPYEIVLFNAQSLPEHFGCGLTNIDETNGDGFGPQEIILLKPHRFAPFRWSSGSYAVRFKIKRRDITDFGNCYTITATALGNAKGNAINIEGYCIQMNSRMLDLAAQSRKCRGRRPYG